MPGCRMFASIINTQILFIMKTILTILSVILFVGSSFSQSDSKIPLIGSKAPSFMTNSTQGKMEFPNDFGKSWKILFSHPQDFTPVCSSELLELADLQDEFASLDRKSVV